GLIAAFHNPSPWATRTPGVIVRQRLALRLLYDTVQIDNAVTPQFVAIVWCFRAMAYQRIGNHEKARQWIGKADQLFEEHRAVPRPGASNVAGF
ncbi:MAG TPA: hypothetical protein VKD72_03515, partial [Gemmataceae bacterium]|nr:hypothetical protein [Gemmataceae bacterium]